MAEIARIPRAEFLEVAEEILERLLTFPELKGRTGGYLIVITSDGKKPLLVAEIGVCDPGKIIAFKLCQEKAIRLLDCLDEGHVSSWQSRNPDHMKYGGGIFAGRNSSGVPEGRNIIGAFSGLPEKGDEAFMLVLWMVFRFIMLDEAEQIALISDNHLFRPLMEACNDLFDRQLPIDRDALEELNEEAAV